MASGIVLNAMIFSDSTNELWFVRVNSLELKIKNNIQWIVTENHSKEKIDVWVKNISITFSWMQVCEWKLFYLIHSFWSSHLCSIWTKEYKDINAHIHTYIHICLWVTGETSMYFVIIFKCIKLTLLLH